MTQEIGMIIEKRGGHKERTIFGHKIFSETPDTFYIVRHNTGMFPFLNYKWLGKFKTARPNQYRERDIVVVKTDRLDTKKILAIVPVGRESRIRYLMHDVHFITLCVLAGAFVILKLNNII